MIDPTGNFVLVANQNTDNVVIFKRNKTTGLLTPTGAEISIPKPVCLKMVK
jgi:6-phosphogluconolactonase